MDGYDPERVHIVGWLVPADRPELVDAAASGGFAQACSKLTDTELLMLLEAVRAERTRRKRADARDAKAGGKGADRA